MLQLHTDGKEGNCGMYEYDDSTGMTMYLSYNDSSYNDWISMATSAIETAFPEPITLLLLGLGGLAMLGKRRA